MTTTAIAPETAGVKIGDFFSASWGYDQTNVDFYKVVGLTPKGVKLQKWSSKTLDGNGFQNTVVPGDKPATSAKWSRFDRAELDACSYCWDEDGHAYYACPTHGPVPTDAPIKTKQLRDRGSSRPSIRIASYANAYLWDGEPEYETDSRAGH